MSDIVAGMEARRARERQPGAPVLAVLAGVVAVLAPAFLTTSITAPGVADIFGGGLKPLELARAVGIVLGLAVLTAAVVWAALYFAVVRRARPAWGLLLLVGLTVASIAGFAAGAGTIGHTLDRERQEHIAATEIREALDAFLKHRLAEPLKAEPPRARGKVGKIEASIRDEMRQVIALKSKYEADIEALKLDQTGPKPSPAELKSMVDRLGKAEATTAAYRVAVRKRLQSIRRSLQNDLSPWVKRRFLPGYEIELGERQGLLDRRLSTTERKYVAMKRMMIVLRDNPSAWTFGSYGVQFSKRAVYDAFSDLSYELKGAEWKLGELNGEDATKAAEFERRPTPLDD